MSAPPRPDLELDPPEAHLPRISGCRVRAIHPSGPVFDTVRPAHRQVSPDLFEPALRTRTRLSIGVLTAGWVVTTVVFWVWWGRAEHRPDRERFVVNTVLLGYLTLLPAYYLVTANRLRRVARATPLPTLRVAFVVAKAPSEPWSLARRTLTAMLAQDFPYSYDVWLCDEDPDEQTLNWCGAHGISVSTRRDATAYHRTTWPRRRRCKEGNLAYFYDRVGYRDYDVVSQLDCDHVPAPTYLREMVRPFIDPAIGYVAAPSVCDANRDVSWAVRGRLYHEATFHGPHQLGHNGSLAPICIGSHYAVRTEALATIGGLGPELAEDFSTSYLLNVAGWTGAFAIDAEAHGDGPTTFAAMLTQEFQWSRSLCTILFGLAPRTLGSVPRWRRVRFLFVLAYYPLLSLTTLAGFLLAAVAAVTGTAWVRVDYLHFLGFWLVSEAWILAISLLLRRQRMLRPADAPVVSWEQLLYLLTRWPFILWGFVAAVIGWWSPRPIDFRVTPKGSNVVEVLPLRILVPYAVLSAILVAAGLFGMRYTGLVGYVGLSLFGAVTYAVTALAVALLHAYEIARNTGAGPGVVVRLSAAPLLVCVAVLVPVALAVAMYPAYLSVELP